MVITIMRFHCTIPAYSILALYTTVLCINYSRERVIICDQRIRERSTHFLKLQKQKTDFEFYEALLLQDQTQLENVFDELHTCHVKQKELNKSIVKETEETATYLTEVREWHQQASELYSTFVSKREATKKG